MNDKSENGQPYTVTHGDVLEVLKTLPSSSYDGGFCDPPYGLGFMGKDWDQNVPGVEVWQETLRVCKSGAYLVAFGSPKTAHRLTCYIEDAGWQIVDTLCWLYGEGCPKSQDFSAKIAEYSSHGNLTERFRGRGTALKPAWEPILLAMKPVNGSFAKNAALFGCAGLDIEQCRIGTCGGTKRSHQAPYPRREDGREDRTQWARTGHTVDEIEGGRYPANLLLDEEAAKMLDRQSGWSRSTRSRRRSVGSTVGNGRTRGYYRSRIDVEGGYDDEGGASRFFYVQKAKGKERDGNVHPAAKPVELCEYLARLILPPKLRTGRRLLVPYSGSGSEMLGGLKAGWDHVHGIEKDEAYRKTSLHRLATRKQDESEDVSTAALPSEPPLQINSVVQGDCAKVIPRLPDKSVNFALCSPPYPGKRGDKYPTVSERDYPAWTARWMDTLKTKLAEDGSVLVVIDKHVKKGVMSDFLLRTQLHLREQGWKQHMTQIWFKHDGLPLGHRGWPHHCYEEILWFSRTTHPFCDPWAAGSPSTNLAVRNYDQSEWTNGGKGEKEGVARVRDVLVVPVGGNAKGVDHPAKYPQALCEALIKTFSPEGGTVLDCFAGSGTTLLAAWATGRSFYGIDIMEKYVDLARGRLEAGGSQAA